MAKYRVLIKSVINFPPPVFQVVRQPGDIVELPDGTETHDNLELLVDQSVEATPLTQSA